MVGDSLGDIKASKAAGVRMALVLWDVEDKDRLLGAGAEHVFHDVAGMLAWFQSLLT